MKRPNPDLVRNWNIDLASTATKAATIADGIRTSAEQMHRAIDAMNWSGEARQAADSRCQREVTQMRVLAAAYDDLATALDNGHSQMGQPVSTLRADYTSLVSDRYIVHFDWTVVDETDDDARTREAANQTIRLQRLADELGWADHNCAQAVNKAYGLKRIPLAGDLLELGWKSTSPEVRLGALGTVPEAATHIDTSTYGSTPAQTYNILQGIANSPGHPDLRSDPNIGRYFDQETGQLRSFEDIRHEGGRPAGTNLPELNTNVGKYAPTVSEYRDRWDSGHGREPGNAPK
ncbi:WXG100 family type VII secretion target [Nocardia salmonicida]|uniref:WXG100 family type VII secretion target n=1 Tax=Nocardia salmonicida TaxID=53431 RepID=UPI00366B16DA